MSKIAGFMEIIFSEENMCRGVWEEVKGRGGGGEGDRSIRGGGRFKTIGVEGQSSQ